VDAAADRDSGAHPVAARTMRPAISSVQETTSAKASARKSVKGERNIPSVYLTRRPPTTHPVVRRARRRAPQSPDDEQRLRNSRPSRRASVSSAGADARVRHWWMLPGKTATKKAATATPTRRCSRGSATSAAPSAAPQHPRPRWCPCRCEEARSPSRAPRCGIRAAGSTGGRRRRRGGARRGGACDGARHPSPTCARGKPRGPVVAWRAGTATLSRRRGER
jgi:hypothetical protein